MQDVREGQPMPIIQNSSQRAKSDVGENVNMELEGGRGRGGRSSNPTNHKDLRFPRVKGCQVLLKCSKGMSQVTLAFKIIRQTLRN